MSNKKFIKYYIDYIKNNRGNPKVKEAFEKGRLLLKAFKSPKSSEKIKKEKTFDPRKPELEAPHVNCEPIGAYCEECVLQNTCEYAQTIFPLIKRFILLTMK